MWERNCTSKFNKVALPVIFRVCFLMRSSGWPNLRASWRSVDGGGSLCPIALSSSRIRSRTSAHNTAQRDCFEQREWSDTNVIISKPLSTTCTTVQYIFLWSTVFEKITHTRTFESVYKNFSVVRCTLQYIVQCTEFKYRTIVKRTTREKSEDSELILDTWTKH